MISRNKSASVAPRPTLRERTKTISNNRRLPRLILLLFVLITCAPLTANADVVTDWNAIALNTSAAAGNGPAPQARVASIMHAAIFDSVNAIEPRYTVYMVSPPVTLPAPPEAATAAAGHGVLVRLFPAAKPSLDNLYAASLAQIADGDAKTNGIAVGEFVAAEMVALRSNDGSAPQPYTLPPAGLGIWRPTAPTPPVSSWLGRMTPFLLESATQFHAPPPPELTSVEYATDVNEVKLYGRATGSLRTDDQTEMARFWIESGALQWNRIARAMAAERQTTLAENARLFALLNMAFSDAGVVVFETKYAFKINGQIVGGFATASHAQQVFLQKKQSLTMMALPNGKPVALDTGGINERGDVVGSYGDGAAPCHGFLLNGDQFYTVEVPGAVTTTANGINARGDIVGGYSDTSGRNHGYLLSQPQSQGA